MSRTLQMIFSGILVLASTSLSAADFHVSGQESNLKFDAQNDGHLRVQLHIGTVRTETVRAGGADYLRLKIDGTYPSATVGEPELPVFSRLIELPAGAVNARARVVSSGKQIFGLAALAAGIKRIYPAQPSQAKSLSDPITFSLNKSAYESQAYQLPVSETVQIEDLGMMRNRHLFRLAAAPLSYSPAKESLAIDTTMTIQLDWDMDGMVPSRLPKTNAALDEILNSAVDSRPLPLTALSTADYQTYPLYMMVAPESYRDSLSEFIAWKTSLGFRVEFLSWESAGGTPEQLRTLLGNRYNSDPGHFPDYLLLVGDNEQIPAWSSRIGSWAHVTDLYYAAITTGDLLPDLMVGRFPAATAGEARLMAEKSMEYEKLNIADGQYLKSIMLIAGYDSYGNTDYFGIPTIDYARQVYFTAAAGYDVTFLSGHADVSSILDKINSGVGFLNYTGHGSFSSWVDPNITNYQIFGLSNDNLRPLVITNGCKTAAFQYATCFGEAWMRHDGGAMAYIGGTNDTYWDEDVYWSCGYYNHVGDGLTPTASETGIGAYDAPFRDGSPVPQSALIIAGNLAVNESTSTFTGYYWEVYELFGDPALINFWSLPEDISAAIPDSLPVGSDELRIPVTNMPANLKGSVSAGSELLSDSWTPDAGGIRIHLPSPLNDPGQVSVTLNAPGYAVVSKAVSIAFSGSVTIIPDTLTVLGSNAVQITVLSNSGTPVSGLQLYFQEPGQVSDTVLTDAAGKASLTWIPHYGPDVDLFGRIPGEDYLYFRETLPLRGCSDLPPVTVHVSTEIGLSDTLASNLPAHIYSDLNTSPSCYYRDMEQSLFFRDQDTVSVTAAAYGEADFYLLQDGYNAYHVKIPIKQAMGKASFVLLDNSANPVPNAMLTLSGTGFTEKIYKSDSEGLIETGEYLPCGMTALRISVYGFSDMDSLFLLPYRESGHRIVLDTAPTYRFSGTVRDEAGQGLPSALYLLDTDGIRVQDSTDVTGNFSFQLPEWDFRVVAAAAGKARADFPIRTDRQVDTLLTLTDADTILLVYPDWLYKGKGRIKGQAPDAGQSKGTDPTETIQDFRLFCQLFNIPYCQASQIQCLELNPGTYRALLVMNGQAEQILGKSFRDVLIDESLLGTDMLLEGGETGYAMRNDLSFCQTVLGFNSWLSDGDVGNALIPQDHEYSTGQPLLPTSIGIDWTDYADEDVVQAADPQSVVALWSDNNTASSLLAWDRHQVYMPFNFSNLQSDNDKIRLFSHTLGYLGIGSRPFISEPDYALPEDGNIFNGGRSDPIPFNWSLAPSVPTVTLRFFTDTLLLSEPVTGTSYELNVPDHFPLNTEIGWTLTFTRNDSLWTSGIRHFTIIERIVGTQDVSTDLPRKFQVGAGYPNPFNSRVLADYDVPETADITIRVYTVQGRQVRNVDLSAVDAGRYTFVWDSDAGGRSSSGIYFIRFVFRKPGSREAIYERTLKTLLIR